METFWYRLTGVVLENGYKGMSTRLSDVLMNSPALSLDVICQWDSKGKGKASSLDIAPLTVLNSGASQPRKWQLTGNDCSTAAHAVAAQSLR